MKLIKRMMYRKAGFALLRQQVPIVSKSHDYRCGRVRGGVLTKQQREVILAARRQMHGVYDHIVARFCYPLTHHCC
jgi:hypothetical protein